MNNYVKMEGLKNDFIVVLGPFVPTPNQIVGYCDRHTGIGADGFLVITTVDPSTIKMDYWNQDGSIAEMCGNGLRCAVKFAVDNKLVTPGVFDVITGAGKLKGDWDGSDDESVEVQIGRLEIGDEPFEVEDRLFYAAKIGNPHALTFVDDVDGAPVKELGPRVEHNKRFPQKTNVEFVQVLSPSKIKVRVWERGAGETQACGTGMVAAAGLAAQVKENVYPMTVLVHGGSAKVWVDDEGYHRMSGPAHIVERGEL